MVCSSVLWSSRKSAHALLPACQLWRMTTVLQMLLFMLAASSLEESGDAHCPL
jgi:hypothetical protein